MIVALLASACCSSLRDLPPKRIAFPAPYMMYEDIVENTGHFFDEKRNRDVPYRTYAPAGANLPLAPVIVSHGIGEDRDSYAYLGRALAHAGFYAVHLTHAGTDRAMLERGYRHLYRATKDPRNWIDRALDVSFVLDRLGANGSVAVVGHSAGAFTAFALAGMRAPDGGTLRDPRVKVIVPMSMPRIAGDYSAIGIPVLNLTGTCDTSIIYRTFPRHRRIPFDASHGPNQYLVTLEGVNHDMFSAREDPHHAVISAITVAFLRAWLYGDPAAKAWFDDAGKGETAGTKLSVERK
jgi:alpha-beta hydrolase superfamily lysophospholipase